MPACSWHAQAEDRVGEHYATKNKSASDEPLTGTSHLERTSSGTSLSFTQKIWNEVVVDFLVLVQASTFTAR